VAVVVGNEEHLILAALAVLEVVAQEVTETIIQLLVQLTQAAVEVG
jgi:hypothetical protein